MKLSVVMPVYNEQATLREVISRVLAVPAPFLYAQDQALAAWILAFDEVSASLRRSILRKVARGGSA